MRVREIFYSLSGEGIHAGIPTVFVRLAGCNLRCVYCDTNYAWNLEDGEEMSPIQIVKRVGEFQKCFSPWVLITGGEPLVQCAYVGELVRALKDCHCLVEVETNGSIDPPQFFRDVDCWSVDVKCPSSGPSYGSFRTKWLRKMRKQDQLKFVVGTQEDLSFVRGFLNDTNLRPTVLVSSIAGILLNKKVGIVEEYWFKPWLQECAEFCKEHNARLSLQMHKLIYGDMRGV